MPSALSGEVICQWGLCTSLKCRFFLTWLKNCALFIILGLLFSLSDAYNKNSLFNSDRRDCSFWKIPYCVWRQRLLVYARSASREVELRRSLHLILENMSIKTQKIFQENQLTPKHWLRRPEQCISAIASRWFSPSIVPTSAAPSSVQCLLAAPLWYWNTQSCHSSQASTNTMWRHTSQLFIAAFKRKSRTGPEQEERS